MEKRVWVWDPLIFYFKEILGIWSSWGKNLQMQSIHLSSGRHKEEIKVIICTLCN